MMGVRLQCGGSGASHGGMGSAGASPSSFQNPICQQLKSRAPYGSPFYPAMEGSGGGGYNAPNNYGGGGGVIYIQVANYALIDGVIDSSAVDFYQDTF